MSTAEKKGIRAAVEAIADHYKMDKKELYKVVMETRVRESPQYKRKERAIENTRKKITDKERAIDEHRVRSLDAAREKIKDLKVKLDEQLTQLKAMEEIPDMPKPHESPKGRKKKIEEKKPEKEEEESEEEESKKPEEKKPQKEEPKEPKKEAGKKKKNLGRVLKEHVAKLKEFAKNSDIEYEDAHTSQFRDYVNNMSEDAFAAKELTEHMKTFIENLEIPNKEDAPKDIYDERVEAIDWEELKERDLIDGYTPGIYYDKVNKTFVTGPDEDSDEDFNEYLDDSTNTTFQIGKTTHRMYTDIGGVPTFVGYANVGTYEDIPDIESDEE